MLIDVHFLPNTMQDSGLAGGVAVIIDILRASSTMATALHHGALKVVPCETPAEAEQKKMQIPGPALLGGERGGVRIPGFDLGNSPAEYTAETVRDCTVLFTTTNGTRALLGASSAGERLVGCFLNLSAICRRLRFLNRPVHLVCAGTDGVITGEDVLFAGAVVRGLAGPEVHANAGLARSWDLSDSARIALGYWTSVSGGEEEMETASLSALLKNTQGGRNLLSLGYSADIDLCSRCNVFEIVPVYVDGALQAV